MKKRRELHIDYHWFLILFSKALGAMIILFIMVPKMTGDVKRQLQELEKMEDLKREVAEMDSVMVILKQSVPEKVFNTMQQKVSQLQKSAQSLELQIKDLQNSLSKCDNQRAFLQEKVSKLTKELEVNESKLKNHDDIVSKLEDEKVKIQNQLEVLKKQIVDCDQLRESIKNKGNIEAQIVDLQKEVEKQLEVIKNQEAAIQKQNDQLQDKDVIIKKKDELIKEQQKQLAECEPSPKSGLDIKDKNVVFVVDLSGSMDDAPETDKLDQVKAGLKMMIATMDESYKVDVVTFPKSKTEDYGYKYGKLVAVTDNTKYDIYRYLSSLKAYGCTPTRQVLNFVLDAPSYKNAGTIIFLSDGYPTKRVSDLDCDDDNGNELISSIKSKNAGSKVINCVGVGADFRNENMSDPKVKFMSDLAAQNKGFYIGF